MLTVIFFYKPKAKELFISLVDILCSSACFLMYKDCSSIVLNASNANTPADFFQCAASACSSEFFFKISA